jgi:hypothetical protein
MINEMRAVLSPNTISRRFIEAGRQVTTLAHFNIINVSFTLKVNPLL